MPKMLYKSALALALIYVLTVATTAYAGTPLLQSAKVVSTNVVTLVFSEPVITAVSDYTNFTGGIYGRTLTNVSGSGTATATLSFTGSPFAYDAVGNLTLASSTVSVADKLPFINGIISLSDDQAPKLLSFSAGLSSNSYGASLAGIADVINLSFTVTKSVETPKVMLDGHTIMPTGSGTGPYFIAYNKVSGDVQGAVPFSLTLTDKSGNSNAYSGSLTISSSAPVSGGGQAAPSVLPSVSPITSVSPVPVSALPAVAASFKFSKLLRLGMTDPEVLELQKRLAAEGFLTATPTGKFGAQTLVAVKAYQKAHGLNPLGHVGPGTRAALNGG